MHAGAVSGDRGNIGKAQLPRLQQPILGRGRIRRRDVLAKLGAPVLTLGGAKEGFEGLRRVLIRLDLREVLHGVSYRPRFQQTQ